MPDWFQLLERERRIIKAAPRHFSAACLVASIILVGFWYLVFNTALGIQKSTIDAYKDRYGDLSNPKDSGSVDDVSKFFVSQTISNFDGVNLVLNFEPIPDSLQILSPRWIAPSVLMGRWGYVDGKTFVFTNGSGVKMKNDLNTGDSKIQYFRKSLH